MNKLYAGLVGLVLGSRAMCGPLEDFVDVFMKDRVPHVQLEQRPGDIEAILAFDGKTITEGNNKKFVALHQSFFANAAGKNRITWATYKDWHAPLIGQDEERALLIYHGGEKDFIVFSPLEIENIYKPAISNLISGKADDDDVKHVHSFLETWMRDSKKGHRDYMFGLVEDMRKGANSKEQAEQFRDICLMKLKGEARFVPGMNSFLGNGKQYTLIGSLHNHNGSGSESLMDLEESKRSPVIVAEYKQNNTVDMIILEDGKRTSVRSGLKPFSADIPRDFSRLSPVSTGKSRVTVDGGNTSLSVPFISKEDMKFVTVCGEGKATTYKAHGKNYVFDEVVPYVVDLVVATNTVGNSIFLDVK